MNPIYGIGGSFIHGRRPIIQFVEEGDNHTVILLDGRKSVMTYEPIGLGGRRGSSASH